jgi:heme A synthase
MSFQNFFKTGNFRDKINLSSQKVWRTAMIVVTLIALISVILFSVDATFKYTSKKQVISGLPKGWSVAIAVLSALLIPLAAYVNTTKGTTGSLVVVGD